MLGASLLLALQVVVAAPDSGAMDSTRTFAPAALARTVRQAALRNANAPLSLRGYRARVTTEVAIVARREDGTEAVAGLEQMASDVRWQRPGTLEQNVTGYRAQELGPNLSSLTYLDRPWLVPVLYGNRMALFFGRDTTERAERRRRRAEERRERRNLPEVQAVHPFSPEGETVYRYSGGDTVATVRVSGRVIPIVRIRVEPRDGLDSPVSLFRGEIDLDGARHEIVRMRGQFLRLGERVTLRERLVRVVAEPMAFVELENQELHGRYWLPARQRIELQVAAPLAGDSRAVVRIVSTMRDVRMELDTALVHAESIVADAVTGDRDSARALRMSDTLQQAPFTLLIAPPESLTRFREWDAPLGEATGSLAAGDFDDVAPDRYRSTGDPRLEPGVERASDLAHFNRVEGVYTGVGARWRLRDAVPGLTLHANAGWAWSEETVRGRAGAAYDTGDWRLTATAGRRLDMTNDFRVAFDSGSSLLAAIFSQDDYDYVDRPFADLRLTRRIPGPVAAELDMEFGVFRDRAVSASLSRGLWKPDSGFRPNRGVDEGSYRRAAVALRINPTGAAEFLGPGTAMRVRLQVARGGLNYERLEAWLAARRHSGPWTAAARGDVGVLFGDEPPAQELFELGGSARLRGYDYKEFVGSEAAMVSGFVSWTSPLLRAPILMQLPFGPRLVLPSPSPTLAVGVQSGWTRLSSDGAREAAFRLGTRFDEDSGMEVPISRPTGGVRTSVELQLRFFGGAVGVGVARAVDRGDSWSFGLVAGGYW